MSPIFTTAMGIALPFGIPLAEKIGDRAVYAICNGKITFFLLILIYWFKLFLVATLIISASVICSSLSESFYLFMGLFGVLFGCAAGLAYMLPLNNAYKYYSKRKGTISGVINAGFGIGSFASSWLIF